MGNQLPRARSARVEVLPFTRVDAGRLDTDDKALKDRMLEAAEATLARGGYVYTALVDDTPTAMLGVAPGVDGSGNIWFHTVNGKERLANPVAFLRASKRVVAVWLDHFTVLYNVMETCDESIAKWLKFLGADVSVCPEENTTTFTITKK